MHTALCYANVHVSYTRLLWMICIRKAWSRTPVSWCILKHRYFSSHVFSFPVAQEFILAEDYNKMTPARTYQGETQYMCVCNIYIYIYIYICICVCVCSFLPPFKMCLFLVKKERKAVDYCGVFLSKHQLPNPFHRPFWLYSLHQQTDVTERCTFSD